MEILKIAVTVLHLLVALALIVVVLFQSSKTQGLSGSIAGGAETFFGKNKGKTLDGLLAKLTVVFAVVFIVTSVGLTMINKSIQENPVVEQDVVQTTPAPDEVEATDAPDDAEPTPEADEEE